MRDALADDAPRAIKELLPEPGASPADLAQAQERFAREARLLASLSHPALPRVYDFFNDDGHSYLVMEYIEGETLEQRVEREGAQSETQALAWAGELCAAVEYLHAQTPPVVFRDVAPDNVMVDSASHIHLIDFGIARVFNPVKQTDTLRFGKVAYAPPEQFGGGGQTTPKSDLFALGATLHYALTGRDPAQTPFVFPPLRELNPTVSPTTEQAVAHVLRLDPAQRPDDARAQGLDLMRLRRQVAFDRLLARLFAEPDPPWLLKGGYAFELRLGTHARATKDLDLSIPVPSRLGVDANHLAQASQPQNALIRERLQDAAERDLHDGFAFRVGAPMTDLDAATYGGARYPIEARLDNRTFATFHLDVGVGDAIATPPEWLTSPDLLGFAGIAPAHAAALSRAQQFAEKVHAYTLPRGVRTNTRVKDLADLVLLVELRLPDAEQVRHALRVTFERRRTHRLPLDLDLPPEEWADPYAALAAEYGLQLTMLQNAFTFIAGYWHTLWQGAIP